MTLGQNSARLFTPLHKTEVYFLFSLRMCFPCRKIHQVITKASFKTRQHHANVLNVQYIEPLCLNLC